MPDWAVRAQLFGAICSSERISCYLACCWRHELEEKEKNIFFSFYRFPPMLIGYAAQIVKGSIRVGYNGNWNHEMMGLFQWLLFICLFVST